MRFTLFIDCEDCGRHIAMNGKKSVFSTKCKTCNSKINVSIKQEGECKQES